MKRCCVACWVVFGRWVREGGQGAVWGGSELDKAGPGGQRQTKGVKRRKGKGESKDQQRASDPFGPSVRPSFFLHSLGIWCGGISPGTGPPGLPVPVSRRLASFFARLISLSQFIIHRAAPSVSAINPQLLLLLVFLPSPFIHCCSHAHKKGSKYFFQLLVWPPRAPPPPGPEGGEEETGRKRFKNAPLAPLFVFFSTRLMIRIN